MSESHGLKGCGNHGCLVQPVREVGVGTNAICKCLEDRVVAERLVRWLRKQAVSKNAELARLLKLYEESSDE